MYDPQGEALQLVQTNPDFGKEFLGGAAAATVGLPGELEYLARVIAQIPGLARGATYQDPETGMPRTDKAAEMIGADLDTAGGAVGQLWDFTGPMGKLLGAIASVAPVVAKAAKTGKAINKEDLAEDMARILDDRPQLEDLEQDVRFIEADTVDPKVDARIKTTGQYRGAPAGIASPQKLGSMRNELKRLLGVGVPGRAWYDESTESIKQLTGDRHGMKHLAAGAHAITSRGAAVPTNRGFGVKGYNQAIAGRPAHTGRFPNDQGAAIDQLASGEPYIGGHKETPFYEGLTVDERGNIRPTNDLWMARAFGYKRKNPETGKMEEWGEGLGQAQHRFMDREINNLVDWANKTELGGYSDWTPERVQAAVWVAKKAEMEGTSVEKALENFSHGLDQLTMNVRWESAPSTELGHLSNISGTDEYNDLIRAIVNTPSGQDRLAMQVGLQTRETVPGFGIYRQQTNPSNASRVLAGFENVEGLNAAGKPKTIDSNIDPASAALGNAFAAGRGLNLGQETIGTTYLRGGIPAGARNAATLNLGRTPDEAQMKIIEQALNDQFGGAVIPVHTDSGVQVLVLPGDDGPAVDPEVFAKGMRQIGKALGAKPDFAKNSGGLIGNTDFDGYRPSKYIEEIDRQGLPQDVMGRLERGMQVEASALEALDDAVMKNMADPGARSEVLQRARKILIEEGLDGIRRAVQAGLLPAFVLTALGATVGVRGPSNEVQGH